MSTEVLEKPISGAKVDGFGDIKVATPAPDTTIRADGDMEAAILAAAARGAARDELSVDAVQGAITCTVQDVREVILSDDGRTVRDVVYKGDLTVTIQPNPEDIQADPEATYKAVKSKLNAELRKQTGTAGPGFLYFGVPETVKQAYHEMFGRKLVEPGEEKESSIMVNAYTRDPGGAVMRDLPDLSGDDATTRLSAGDKEAINAEPFQQDLRISTKIAGDLAAGDKAAINAEPFQRDSAIPADIAGGISTADPLEVAEVEISPKVRKAIDDIAIAAGAERKPHKINTPADRKAEAEAAATAVLKESDKDELETEL